MTNCKTPFKLILAHKKLVQKVREGTEHRDPLDKLTNFLQNTEKSFKQAVIRKYALDEPSATERMKAFLRVPADEAKADLASLKHFSKCIMKDEHWWKTKFPGLESFFGKELFVTSENTLLSRTDEPGKVQALTLRSDTLDVSRISYTHIGEQTVQKENLPVQKQEVLKLFLEMLDQRKKGYKGVFTIFGREEGFITELYALAIASGEFEPKDIFVPRQLHDTLAPYSQRQAAQEKAQNFLKSAAGPGN